MKYQFKLEEEGLKQFPNSGIQIWFASCSAIFRNMPVFVQRLCLTVQLYKCNCHRTSRGQLKTYLCSYKDNVQLSLSPLVYGAIALLLWIEPKFQTLISIFRPERKPELPGGVRPDGARPLVLPGPSAAPGDSQQLGLAPRGAGTSVPRL